MNGEANARTAQLFGGLVNQNVYSDAGAVLFGCPRDENPNQFCGTRLETTKTNLFLQRFACWFVRLFVVFLFVRVSLFVYVDTFLSAFLSVFGFRRPIPNLFFLCEHSHGNGSRVVTCYGGCSTLTKLPYRPRSHPKSY